jgi:hypothetical protein
MGQKVDQRISRIDKILANFCPKFLDLRDTFLAYFRPPLPHVTFGDTDAEPPPPDVA